MEVRRAHHHIEKANVQGHIFVSFLGLYLAALPPKKLAAADQKPPWDEVIRDLSELRAVEVELDGQRYLLRSPLERRAGKVFAAVGAKVPPLAQALWLTDHRRAPKPGGKDLPCVSKSLPEHNFPNRTIKDGSETGGGQE